MSTTEIVLAEFGRVRDEIDSRTQLASQIIALDLTALGAGITVIDQAPDVLIALAAVTSLLWLLWLDQAVQVYKLAAYVGLQLAPRLHATDPAALGWERFLRALDAGGPAAYRVLFRRARGPGEPEHPVPPTRSIARYAGVLFGGTPPVLIAIYLPVVLARDTPALGEAARVAGAAIALGLWAYALYEHRSFNRMTVVVGQALGPAGDDS